jgi:nickel/cobalt exporter
MALDAPTAMDSLFVPLALFTAGVLHGLGPDHLAAIAALVGRGTGRQIERRQLALLGLRFGLGHVTALVLLAVTVWALGRSVPDNWQRGLEQAGGVVLVLLGGWILAEVFRRRVVVHSHSHRHTQAEEEHEHVHIHLRGEHPRTHSHPHLATMVGGLLGFSGARALLVALPIVAAGSADSMAVRVVAFGAGIVVSMTLAGWLAQAALARAARTPAYARVVVGATGVLSSALGLYWLARFAVP